MARTTASWAGGHDHHPGAELDDHAGVVAAVDLDAPGGDPGPSPGPRRRGQLAGALALALAAAAVTSLGTGLAVHHRVQAAADARAAAQPPRLEVGYPEVRSLPPRGGAPTARVVLPVHNAGDTALTVTGVELTERAGPARMEQPDLVVEPGARERVVLETSPRCEVVATRAVDVADLDVRGPDGRTHTVSVELAAPFGRPALDGQLHGLCNTAGPGRPVQVAVSLLPDRRTLVLHMTNGLPHATQLSLWAPSASGIVSDPPLPLVLRAGEDVSVSLTASPRCETWSGGLPSMSVDVVSSRPPVPDGLSQDLQRDVPSGWSALMTAWLGGQVVRACEGR